MMNQKMIFSGAVGCFLMALLQCQNIIQASMICLCVWFLGLLIEDQLLKKIARIIFSISLIVISILYFVGIWNHGLNFDGTFKHIF